MSGLQVAAASKRLAATIQRRDACYVRRVAGSAHEGGVCLPRGLCATTPAFAYARVGRVWVFDLEGVEGEGEVAVVADDGDELDHARLAEAGHAVGVVGRGHAPG